MDKNLALEQAPLLGMYDWLAGCSRLSYRSKIMLIAFVGTHIPLLTLIGYFVISTSADWAYTLWVLSIVLMATLLGTGVTLLALNQLLRPILLISQQLRRYRTEGKLPTLPAHYTDEVGILMADTLFTLHKLDKTIYELAHYDRVTGLPNRDQFLRETGQRIAPPDQDKPPFAVAVIRIENFGQLKATFGQPSAEAILRTLARRLEIAVGHRYLVARTDDTSFAVLFQGIFESQQIMRLMASIDDIIKGRLTQGGTDVLLKTSAGVSFYPGDGNDPQALLNNAFTALAVASGW
jgi:diguanylate cyclase (GGDEF)-like protein